MADIKQENNIQREAFEFYYGLGEQRSLKAVANHFNRAERTVAGWSRAFNWVDRCSQRAMEEAKGREKASMVLDVKTTYRKLCNNLIAVANKDFKEGKLKIRSISDLEKIVKLDMAMIDNPVDTLQAGTYTLSADDKQRIDNLKSSIESVFSSLRE